MIPNRQKVLAGEHDEGHERILPSATPARGDKDRGRDTYCYAPPAQNRTCGFPASGSHLGCVTSGPQVHGPLVCDPAHVTRKPDTEFGACFARPHSPWSPPLAPSTPPLVAQLRSWTSQLLLRGLTSRVRSSSASAHHLPHADRCDANCPAKREISQVPTCSFYA